MRQLPKPEYYLMKALIAKYALRDESELFAVALRLWSTVERFSLHGTDTAGCLWIADAVETLRHRSEIQRTADYHA